MPFKPKSCTNKQWPRGGRRESINGDILHNKWKNSKSFFVVLQEVCYLKNRLPILQWIIAIVKDCSANIFPLHFYLNVLLHISKALLAQWVWKNYLTWSQVDIWRHLSIWCKSNISQAKRNERGYFSSLTVLTRGILAWLKTMQMRCQQHLSGK